MIPVKETIKADVAIVGGGIGGLMAAIAAADAGAKNVVLLEKANTRRSGSGATGNDHFLCYIPEIHGENIEAILAQVMGRTTGMHKDPAMMRSILRDSFETVKQWESWGINMRPYGEEYVFQGHALPGKIRPFLKYNGQNQKKVLTEQAKKRGVKILNHHPVMEIASDGEKVLGLLALDMKGDDAAFLLVEAPSVILATGLSHRLYTNGATPSHMFNTAHCPNCAGGQALGWRAGASMVNMEMPYTHGGPRNFERCGKGTWIGVCRYPDGRPIGPFTNKSNVEYGDVTSDVWTSVFTDVLKNGTGPAYIDCTDASAEDLEHMHQAMKDEGLTAMLNYMDEEGIDPARDAVEFMRYEPILHGRGLDVDMNGETRVRGLFAAGDMVGNAGQGIGLAAVIGKRAGTEAGKRAKTAAGASPAIAENARIRQKMQLLSEIYERQDGAEWQEANFALQRIMDDYAAVGPYGVRSESLLTAGLNYLENLRERTQKNLQANNPHKLMRAAEVLDLFDCGEVIMRAARERKETRMAHKRTDYTFTNPLLNDQLLTLHRDKDGEVVIAWRDKRM